MSTNLVGMIKAGFLIIMVIYYIFIIFSTLSVNQMLGLKKSSSVIIALLMPIVATTEIVSIIANFINNFFFDQICHVGGIDPQEYEDKLHELSESEIE